MRKGEVKASLRRAVDQLPHRSFEEMASAPVQKIYTQDVTTYQSDRPSFQMFPTLPLRRIAVAFACCMVILAVGVVWSWQNLMVESFITIDVNPSFEITTNRSDRVLSVEALNEDAREFVEGKSFRGWAVDDAVELLFEELGRSRYITTERNTVLLSVQSKAATHGKKLEQGLVQQIEKALEQTGVAPQVLSQTLEAAGRQEAEQYHASAGKLQLAKRMKENTSDYSLEQLVAMPMWQLAELLEESDEREELDDDGELPTEESEPEQDREEADSDDIEEEAPAKKSSSGAAPQPPKEPEEDEDEDDGDEAASSSGAPSSGASSKEPPKQPDSEDSSSDSEELPDPPDSSEEDGDSSKAED